MGFFKLSYFSPLHFDEDIFNILVSSCSIFGSYNLIYYLLFYVLWNGLMTAHKIGTIDQ